MVINLRVLGGVVFTYADGARVLVAAKTTHVRRVTGLVVLLAQVGVILKGLFRDHRQ